MTVRWSNIVIDCADPKGLGSFWSRVFGVPLQGPSDGEYWIEPGGEIPDILFIAVPEEKTVKNRVHIDLRGEHQAAEVDRLLALGAHHVDIGQGVVRWVVLADPEGNEFCVLSDGPAPETSTGS